MFEKLGLSNKLLKSIEKMNYSEPTEIQKLAIPYLLDKKDLIGIAQTGTGKTAAFSLPIINSLMENSEADRKIKVLILSPTRELAIQIRDNVRSLSDGTKFKCSVILGGVNQQSQITVLRNGVDILVATPGRLLDLVSKKKADLSLVEYLVLDEADTMLDMGFIRDVRKLIERTPKSRQTMLFSATMSDDIKKISDEFLINPKVVKATVEATTAPKIDQQLYMVDKRNKTKLLLDLINTENLTSALIFTRTKYGANRLESELLEKGIKSSVIHGNKSQNRRMQALSDFKKGITNIMIATDIAARGIDIKELSHVINYDVPEHPEVYVHRIGRTARAGKSGVAITLCSIDEVNKLSSIEKLIKKEIREVKHKYPMQILIPNKKSSKSRTNNNSSKQNKDRNNNSKTRKHKSKGKNNTNNRKPKSSYTSGKKTARKSNGRKKSNTNRKNIKRKANR